MLAVCELQLAVVCVLFIQVVHLSKMLHYEYKCKFDRINLVDILALGQMWGCSVHCIILDVSWLCAEHGLHLCGLYICLLASLSFLFSS